LVFGVKKSPYPDSSIMQAMTIQLGGNVGIGTTTPKVKIESVSGINAYPAVSNTLQSGSALRLRGGDNSILDFGLNSTNTWIQATNQTNLAYNYNICLNPNGGNVGIGTGTISPTAKLDVNGIIKTNADIQLGVSQVNSYLKMNTDSRTWWAGIGVISGDDRFDIYDATAGYYALTIGKDGNVGIGIGTATAAYKLEVKGTIHANEVIVDFKGTIADFVFKPTYKLMPLNQVEQFVKTNNHLPEIPSAAEIKKNGLSMGEMQNKLLQKVEELTLYVIEQQKEINLLKQELKK